MTHLSDRRRTFCDAADLRVEPRWPAAGGQSEAQALVAWISRHGDDSLGYVVADECAFPFANFLTSLSP